MEDMKRIQEMEDYVFGRLGDAERAAFEEKMAADQDLRNEVEALASDLKLVRIAGAGRDYARFREMSEAGVQRRSQRRFFYFGAAAFLVAASLALFFLLRPSPTYLDTYFSPADPSSILAPGPTDPIKVGMSHYESGDFAAAANEFAKVESSDLEYNKARFYRANALLAEGDVEAAGQLLAALDTLELEDYWERVKWIRGLVLLDAGEKEAGTALLRELRDDPRSNYKAPEIEAILKSLD